MNSLFHEIQSQPQSLRGLLAYHSGSGRNTLGRVAADVRHAKRLVFTGMGSSLFACTPAVSLLNAHGRPSSSIEASELLYYSAPALSRDTAAVLVSRSGETVEIVKLIPELRARGVHIIGVTNTPDSTLAKLSDIVVPVHSEPDKLVALQTYTGTTAVLLALAALALGRKDYLMDLSNSMQALIDECFQARESWRSWLESATAIYVLGRGASLGSVQEGALLFHEAARTPAIPMSAAHFRHGPVEVTTSGLRAIVFATQSETRALDLRLAADLNALGGQVKVIGPATEDALCRWKPDYPSNAFASVLEIVPVQIAAASLAEWRAIRPGEFRYAPLVTVDETGFENPASLPTPSS